MTFSTIQRLAGQFNWAFHRKEMRRVIQEKIEAELDKVCLEQANAIHHARETGRREGAAPGTMGIDEMSQMIDDALTMARKKIDSAKSSNNLQALNSALDTLNKALLVKKKLNPKNALPADPDSEKKSPFAATPEELEEIEAALQESS